MEYLIHFVAAIILATLSSMSGGGGGLVMTPYLLLWGVPPLAAIGSGKIGGFGLTVASTLEFHKAKLLDVSLSKKLVPLVFLASIVGSLIAVEQEADLLETLVAISVLIISLVLLVFLITGLGIRPRATKNTHRIIGFVGYGINTIFQSGLGSGIGMLNSVILISAFGLTAIQALAVKRLVNIVGLLGSSIVFVSQGVINWVLAATLVGGYFIGARVGTKVAISKGNRFVLSLQVIMGLIVSVALLIT